MFISSYRDIRIPESQLDNNIKSFDASLSYADIVIIPVLWRSHCEHLWFTHSEKWIEDMPHFGYFN